MQRIENQKHATNFESIFLYSAIGMAIVGLDGQWLQVNHAVISMTGYDEAELLKTNFQSLTHPDDLDKDLVLVQKLLQNQIESYQIEKRYIRKDHSIVEALLTVSLIRDQRGEPEYFISQIQDITNSKKLTEQIKHHKDWLQIALECSQIGVWDWDIKNDTLAWNEQMFKLYGLKENTFTAKYTAWVNSLYPDDRERALASIQMALQGDADYNTEFRVVWPDGTVRHLRAHAKVAYNERGQAYRMIGVNWDITIEKEYEKKLIKAEKQSKNIAEKRTRFLADMSHEIRTPINGVLGMAELLLDTPLKETQREYVRAIDISGRSLLTIINDILDLSRLESGALQLENIPYSLIDVAYEAIKPIEVLAKRREQKINLFADEGFQFDTSGDPGKVRQILTNLLNNAIKFSKNGDINIRIHAPKADSPHFIRIEVEDHGVGMNKETLSKIFKPFVQASSSTARKYGGSGLGLAICKSIVEKMGSEIGVVSKLREGSTFWFTIPFVPVTRIEKVYNHINILLPDHLRSKKILLAEDDDINKLVFLKMLEKMGLRADSVGNGKEVLTALAEKSYDLILMDCQMPEMDGYEAARLIRSNLDQQSIPILALTANAITGDREKCLEVGMNDYLSKPVSLLNLREKLEKLL